MTAALEESHWRTDRSSPVLELTAGDALRQAAAMRPDRTGLIEVYPDAMPSLTKASRCDRSWTYAELLADAEACARWLLLGLEPGERICLWAPNVPEWVIIQYGAALAGLVVVTANPALREAELRHVLTTSGSAALFYVDEFRGTDMAAVVRQVEGDVRVARSLSGFIEEIRSGKADLVLPEVSHDSPAQIQFTSGTTGKPKGALLRHSSLVTNAFLLSDRAGQSEDVIVTPMPLFHTAGSVLGVLGAATTLSTLIVPVLFDPELMLATMSRYRATYSSGVPTMLAAMLDALDRSQHDLSSLKGLISGGAPVPPELHARVERGFGCCLVSLYGQTELSPTVSATSPLDSVEDRALTSGKPLPQIEVRIVDPTSGNVVKTGVDGEVQARGYQTMIGYVQDEEATAKTLLPDGWLRTGDIGRLDPRGFLQITGRMSDMIIRGGENVYPAEVEAALAQHPDVLEAAVFGVPDQHWGEIIAAAVRAHPQVVELDTVDLKEHCRRLLAPHKTPAAWFQVESFPMTASGKVQKAELGRLAASSQLLPVSS